MKLNEFLPEAKKHWLAPTLKPWMFQNKEDIEKWLTDNNIRGMVKPHELEIDLPSYLQIDFLNTKRFNESLVKDDKGRNVLPVQFNTAGGSVEIHSRELNSLVGLPFVVFGDLELDVDITTLEGFPKLVHGKIVIGSSQTLTSIEGLCDGIKNLRFNSPIQSLKGLPSSVHTLSLDNVLPIEEFKQHCPDIEKLSINNFEFGKDSMLKFFQFKHLTKLYLYNEKMDSEVRRNIVEIVNKHLGDEKDALECQEELIDAGFGKYAR